MKQEHPGIYELGAISRYRSLFSLVCIVCHSVRSSLRYNASQHHYLLNFHAVQCLLAFFGRSFWYLFLGVLGVGPPCPCQFEQFWKPRLLNSYHLLGWKSFRIFLLVFEVLGPLVFVSGGQTPRIWTTLFSVIRKSFPDLFSYSGCWTPIPVSVHGLEMHAFLCDEKWFHIFLFIFHVLAS